MEITEEHRRRASRMVVGDTPGERAYDCYLAAVERIKVPGRFRGELARADGLNEIGNAVIESETPATIDVFVCDMSDSAAWTPDEARAFAFELLVLADLAEGESGT